MQKERQAYCHRQYARPVTILCEAARLSVIFLGTVARIVLRIILAAVLRIVLVAVLRVIAGAVLRTILAVIARIILTVIRVVFHLIIGHDSTS